MVNLKFVNGGVRQYPRGIALLEVSRDLAFAHNTPIVAAKVDNDIKDLQSVINNDCRLEFLDLLTEEGNKVYQRSLTLVMVAAAKQIFPAGNITVEHSLGKGLYCELYLEDRPATAKDITNLEERMRRIINADQPIVRKRLPTPEAIKLFEGAGQPEKAKLLKMLNRETVSIYYCEDVYDYFYSSLVPSTGYLKVFGLKYYAPGFILRFPSREKPRSLPTFVDQPKLARIFWEAEQWGKILHCGYVSTLNDCIEENSVKDIVRVAEALHEKKIAQIADYIAEHRREVRIILVAGPSSSGKTTFAERLSVQLKVNGVRPVPISLDDYFVDRVYTPRDEQGNYDFEDIEALDLELFNNHLTELLAGREVVLPAYNFMTGEREYRGRKIRVEDDQPLIIEGIHGLNERLTQAIPKEHKVKIYISALTQLSIDNHNRIPTTDTRLIRRIVRDSQFRNNNAVKTLQIWQSVRRGEERNIFPFQEDADIMFNSALIYELAVLKKYAEPLLERVPPDSGVYPEARRLLKFLAFFRRCDENEVPTNSILREFIGNSCFCQ